MAIATVLEADALLPKAMELAAVAHAAKPSAVEVLPEALALSP